MYGKFLIPFSASISHVFVKPEEHWDLLTWTIEVTVSVELLILLRKQSHHDFPSREARCRRGDLWFFLSVAGKPYALRTLCTVLEELAVPLCLCYPCYVSGCWAPFLTEHSYHHCMHHPFMSRMRKCTRVIYLMTKSRKTHWKKCYFHPSWWAGKHCLPKTCFL